MLIEMFGGPYDGKVLDVVDDAPPLNRVTLPLRVMVWVHPHLFLRRRGRADVA